MNRPRHLLVVGLLLSAGRFVIAADEPLDPDLGLQGEYAGYVQQSPAVSRWTGLQVVARGHGEFIAVESPGGLPGNGGTMSDRRKLSGSRTPLGVELTGEKRMVAIRDHAAIVHDLQGHELGRLKRVHRLSRTLGAPPPPGAKVLFDGTGVDRFAGGSMTAGHLLNVGAETRDSYGDFTLHLEFQTPFLPDARDQARGNSGVYIQGRYEVQILDSFGLDGLNNECGGLYKTQPPIVNMCFPPLSWQTYDIDFTAARFTPGGLKTMPAKIAVRHNGIVIHKDYYIPNKTGAGAAEGPEPRPIKLQQHGNPVHFRNIWIVEHMPGECCSGQPFGRPAPVWTPAGGQGLSACTCP